MEPVTDPYMLKPTLTSEGKRWTQRCFICARPVDYLHSNTWQRVRVGELVRHADCLPPPAI